MSLLSNLIEADFGLEIRGRWGRSVEHSSLVYDVDKDRFYFNSSDIYGDAYVYLTQVRQWKHDQAKEFLKENNYTATFIQEIKNKEEVITYPALVDAFHENIWEVDRSYFYNRLLTDDTISRFRLGYFNKYYTIPIYQDGIFKQMQLRRDSPKLIRNWYKNVGPLLFNSDILKFTKEVYITEGIISAILLSQEGVPAVSMNIGSEGFQAKWIKYFTGIKKVYILFDRDNAGDMGAKRVAEILGVDRCLIYNFWDMDSPGYAVDDYFIDGGTWESLRALINDFSRPVYEMPGKRAKKFVSKGA